MSVQVDQPGDDDATAGVDDCSGKMAGYIGRNGQRLARPSRPRRNDRSGPSRARQLSALDQEVERWSPVPGRAYTDRRGAQWKKVAMWSRTS